MFEQGVSKSRLRRIAAMLLNVVRFLDLLEPRAVTMTELRQASQRWLTEPGFRAARRPAKPSVTQFMLTATHWLRFQNQLNIEMTPATPTGLIVQEFRQFLSVVKGYSAETVRTYSARVFHFLTWALTRRDFVSKILLCDVDDFLALKRRDGYLPRSIGSVCAALRLFFRYAEARGWNDSQIQRDIRGPRIPRYGAAPKGPKWKDVRRLLDNSTNSTVELRAVAMLCLCAIYGLRSSEVCDLKLDAFDWVNETFVVRRAKRGRVQQFPLQFEVGEAIIRYLQQGRPKCPNRNLFVSLRPPYRPVRSTTVWDIAAIRMKKLGIESENYGGHSLRHSCATELLRQGSSLRDIADLLGHRDMKSVCIYAKYDLKSLQQVATFSLAGVK